jgi:hypothetical protein
MHVGSSRSQLEQTSKELFDKEMTEWRALIKAGNWKMEVAKLRQLLMGHAPAGPKAAPAGLLDPELAAVDVLLSRIANAVMTTKEARSKACEQAGVNTGAWSKKIAGSDSLGNRVSKAMRSAKISLQKNSLKAGGWNTLLNS